MNSLLTGLLAPATELIAKFIPDKDKAAEIAFRVATMADNHHQELMLGQMEINKADAESGNFWQSGWRPFFGWAGGMAFVNNFILMPYIQIFADVQPMDWATMSPVVMGILGLGTARTVEKVKGKS